MLLDTVEEDVTFHAGTGVKTAEVRVQMLSSRYVNQVMVVRYRRPIWITCRRGIKREKSGIEQQRQRIFQLRSKPSRGYEQDAVEHEYKLLSQGLDRRCDHARSPESSILRIAKVIRQSYAPY